MPVGEYAQRLAQVAIGEHKTYAGFPEDDETLYERIYETYLADLKIADPKDDLGWSMPTDISAWAWSATFVSWCVLQAGATQKEFDFSIRHAIYIKSAIANADNSAGVFRARKITEYAPQVGDLIAGNRGGGSVTYSQARNLDSYNSHTAIVVELTVENGVRYAVTIGGNETDSIRRKRYALRHKGVSSSSTPIPTYA